MAPPERLPAVGDLHLQLHATSFFAGNELSGTIGLSLNQAVQDACKQAFCGSFCCSCEIELINCTNVIAVQINGTQRLHWMYIARVDFTPVKRDQWFKHLVSQKRGYRAQ
jgi:hypothetical protein